MHVLFVGGTSEVGASCLAVQIANQWIVIDAGVRVDRSADPLPDFALLEGKDVRAIFVTHAHADHIGSLPLLHQAYPTAPIFASRATGLLMEVMLADAQRIMQRRAVEEMELPLYPNDLVERMLNQVRPLPIGEAVLIPELPDLTVIASLAGHIAGAVSFGFVAPDGSLVVSGDISVTDQRTVAGAQPPPLEKPDLLVLEATYGSRLHANRQAEEQRLAQAVAEGIERGGPVLIPCFGLGRGQEVLLLLVDAQQRGLIPEFPIYVDGLVRRVCSTYHLLPEALTPRLMRQIRKGYYPFAGRRITYVKDEHDRERILAGEPACIISSSGMLTGGPSVWYAARLVANPLASILITSYQDEESPGKRLLDIAEHRQESLELDGVTVPIHCQVGKYSLSAHADAGELASYAAALQPQHVALVHGDDESRGALRARLTDTQVLLPDNASAFTITGGHVIHSAVTQQKVIPLSELTSGVGKGTIFAPEHVEKLWQAVSQVPTLRIVTARELAFIWEGHADEGTIARILDVLKQDPRSRYFMPHRALEEAFYVRGKSISSELFSDLIGQVLFVQVAFGGSPMPALCRGLLPTASVRVQFAPGVSDRIRYAYSAILDVLGPLPEHLEERQVSSYLLELNRQARILRRSLSVHKLANLCQENATYSLSDLCELAGVSANALADRLAVADLVQRSSSLFYVQQMPLYEEGQTLYTLAPNWQEVVKRNENESSGVQIDRRAILQIIEQHIGNPPDLYRRRFDAESGDVILSFHFPDIARKKYQQALSEAAEEADVTIAISPYAHQDALAEVACQVLPEGSTIQSHPSVYQETKYIHFEATGQTTPQALKEAQARFRELTGWHLTFTGITIGAMAVPQAQPETVAEPVLPKLSGVEDAVSVAEQRLNNLPGFMQVESNEDEHSLILSFLFPDIARGRYAALWQEIADTTGWSVKLVPVASRDALIEVAKRSLPDGLVCVGIPEVLSQQKVVRLIYDGHDSQEDINDARTEFQVTTGWMLSLIYGSTTVSIPANNYPGNYQYPRAGGAHTSEKPYRMEDALHYAQDLLKLLPGYLRVKVEADTRTLVPRFTFPDIAKERYAAQLASITEVTGWNVRLHLIIYPPALKEVLEYILPEGISCIDTPSIYQDKRKVGIVCVGSISPDAVVEVQQKFLEETGWSLELRGSSVEPTLEEVLQVKAPAVSRMQAMLRVVEAFGSAPDFYQIGVDDRRLVLWLHFYFPELARIRYGAEIEHLSQEIGWNIDIDKDVHQKALVEAVLHLLPPHVTIIGKKAVLHEQLTLRLTCTGSLDADELQTIQRCFTRETGWNLLLDFSGQHAFYIASQAQEGVQERHNENVRAEREPMLEHDAQAFVQARLAQHGVVQRQLVDVMRHILLVHFKQSNGQNNIDMHLLTELEKETGWQIKLA
ncbi:MBL fold metallo-hydrolase [Dictyobacter arantiisoli]|uniref:MBL fold hydrolase n=1 Tax=Dictyobacter arantiisoli TaxID=2014874 RepID=A0A5A5TCH1_9CHLR|nr:MBL fold metallo-hydrolase [Dictyobacter arantiisoli]GCF09037.1 hypothetical protein KDI_26010 [Dictyobacter arantiisoli]